MSEPFDVAQDRPSRRRAIVWTVVRAVLAVIGIGVIAWLVHQVGVDELSAVIVPALPWLPLAALLEIARIGMDALSSHYALGRQGERVPPLPMFGAHFVAYAVMGVAPAGRPTSEAVKAALLSRWLGGGSAAALAAANQANTLLALGTITLLSAAASYALTGWSVLTYLLVVHFVMMNVSGLAVRAAARYERLTAWIGVRFPRLARHVAAFQETSRETSFVPVKPVSAMLAGRVLQATQYGLLAFSVGLTPGVLDALALHGIHLVVASLGVMVPGQLGASEGGFALAAETLRVTQAQAMAIALLAHAVQLSLSIAGFLVLLFWRPPKRAVQ